MGGGQGHEASSMEILDFFHKNHVFDSGWHASGIVSLQMTKH